MKNFVSEFKQFVREQNVVGAGIGMIVALASKDYINVIINALISPIIDRLLGLMGAEQNASFEIFKMKFAIGSLISGTISFITIMLVAFAVVKVVSKSFAEGDTAAPSKEEELLEQIRDILKENNTAPKKAPAKKTAAKTTTAKKTPAKKTAVKTTTAKKTPAKKTAAKKTTKK